MGNTLAYLAILTWPLFVLFFFTKYNNKLAIILSVFGSYLFLPASFQINLPGIPAFDKTSVTTMTLFVIIYLKSKSIGVNELDKVSKFIFLLLLISPFITAITNTGVYLHLPGMSMYDGLSQVAAKFLIFITFLIGAKYFNDFQSQKLLLKSIVVACLVYVPLMLYEVRMSPQLHNIFYGFFPHSFIQQVRFDGFRPVVFLGHGLLVALFVSISCVIVLALIKAKIKYKKINLHVAFISIIICLILSKTYGAAMLFLFSASLLLLFKHKTIGYISVFVVCVYISYPLMSANGWFPHTTIVSMVENLSPERAQSLDFRFYHENNLLAHANNKPLFGWGSWGRNRVYDPETFSDLSVTDGRWIITLGTVGWFGFITEFYFLFISVFFAAKVLNRKSNLDIQERILFCSHLLVVIMILIDQIPNASLNYFYWLIIGSLYGYSKKILDKSLNSNF